MRLVDFSQNKKKTHRIHTSRNRRTLKSRSYHFCLHKQIPFFPFFLSFCLCVYSLIICCILASFQPTYNNRHTCGKPYIRTVYTLCPHVCGCPIVSILKIGCQPVMAAAGYRCNQKKNIIKEKEQIKKHDNPWASTRIVTTFSHRCLFNTRDSIVRVVFAVHRQSSPNGLMWCA